MKVPLPELIRRLLKSVRKNTKRGTTFVSFETPLLHLCRAIRFNNILEFSPGYSTEIFIKYTDAKIIALETDLDWYNHYKKRFDPQRVQMLYLPPGEDLSIIFRYGRTFNLVFIDGGERLSALKFAHHVANGDGIVFLHDAHREDHEDGIRIFPYIYFPERHSCLLFKDQAVFERTRVAVPVDYSCQCRYCSTPERRAYFGRFTDQ